MTAGQPDPPDEFGGPGSDTRNRDVLFGGPAEYEAASERWIRAGKAQRAAELAAAALMRDADREMAAAELELSRFERAPGCPWPQYLDRPDGER